MLTYQNQTAVSTRDLAWNTLNEAENLSDGPMTAQDVLDAAGLSGWNTRHVPLQAAMGDHPAAMEDWGTAFPDQRGVLATIDGKVTPLGVVGGKHHIVQNEETTALLDTVVDESGAHYVGAAKMRGGRQTFVVMKMPNTILIGGEDAHDTYFGCTNHHDGGGSLVAWVTTLRLRCTNMHDSAVKGAKSKWRLRHTASIGGRVQEARDSLRLSFKWAEQFQKQAEQMLLTPMSGDEFDAVLDRLAAPSTSDKAGWVARAEEKRQTLRFLFHEAETNEFGRGTRWAAYNAFTEYADHFYPIRSKAPNARAERLLADDTISNFKQSAFDALVPA